MQKFRFFLFLFGSAFVVNVVWEFGHVWLYDVELSVRGHIVCCGLAAFADALYILALYGVIALVGKNVAWGKNARVRDWLTFVSLALLMALLIEWHALATGRWVYGPTMPLVPGLGIGFTPFIQLAVTGVVSVLLAVRFSRKKEDDIVASLL